MRAVALFFACAGISLVGGVGNAAAGSTRHECDAVLTLSEIQYDSRMLVSIARDNEAKTCSFYVDLPPENASSDAMSDAAEYAHALVGATPDSIKDKLSDNKFVDSVIRALVAPLEQERYQTGQGQALAKAIGTESEAIQQCAIIGFVDKKEFQPVSDVISCGITDEDIPRLIIEAALFPIAVTILLPIAT